jgi:hypothetical protein
MPLSFTVCVSWTVILRLDRVYDKASGEVHRLHTDVDTNHVSVAKETSSREVEGFCGSIDCVRIHIIRD